MTSSYRLVNLHILPSLIKLRGLWVLQYKCPKHEKLQKAFLVFSFLFSFLAVCVLGVVPVSDICRLQTNSTDKQYLSLRTHFKDGAYYCYCAYVLRISRYSDFLSLMLTNTGIFLRGLKLSGESRS